MLLEVWKAPGTEGIKGLPLKPPLLHTNWQSCPHYDATWSGQGSHKLTILSLFRYPKGQDVIRMENLGIGLG